MMGQRKCMSRHEPSQDKRGTRLIITAAEVVTMARKSIRIPQRMSRYL
jgi:hypothetical protein